MNGRSGVGAVSGQMAGRVKISASRRWQPDWLVPLWRRRGESDVHRRFGVVSASAVNIRPSLALTTLGLFFQKITLDIIRPIRHRRCVFSYVAITVKVREDEP